MHLDENAITFPSSGIQSLTASGLLYRDHEGKFGYIDFEECYQNWKAWELQHLDRYYPPMSEARFYDLTKELKEVGSRNALDESPFIIFYSEPQIRFQFETYDEISEFYRRLYELGGWYTYDLA